MNHTVNVALQVLPTARDKHPYDLVDEAIRVIAASGLKYRVTPFETVMEGDYDRIMQVVHQAQEACYAAGADSLMTYIKIQSNATTDVTIEDKTGKYDR